MTKWVEWSEPFGNVAVEVVCRMRVEDVIHYMIMEYQVEHKDHPNYPYRAQDEALQDFLTIHWGRIVEDAD